MRSPGRFALLASLAAILAATAAAPVLAQAKGGAASAGEKPHYIADRTFLLTAATGALEQVRLARLAVLRASDPGVKSFAQKVVDDFGKADGQLRQLAASKGVKDLPTHPDQSTKALFVRFDKLAGANFDVEYIRQVVEDQQAAAAQFSNEAQNGADADVKHFAATFLPTLRDALSMGQGLENRIAGRAPTGPGQ